MKGIEFLKKIGRIDEAMLAEAATPIKKSRKWNGNMIKFAGLAACIAVFVGAICVSRIGVSQKKNRGAMTSVESNTSEEDSQKYSGSSQENLGIIQETLSEEKPISARMVMLEGRLYLDAGESDIDARCGMLDGNISSSVESGKYPEEDCQSNFGSGYGFQYVGENSIDVNIDGQWIRFEASGSNIQEQPITDQSMTGIDMSMEHTSQDKNITEVPPNETEETTKNLPDGLGFGISLKADTLTSQGAEFIIFNSGYETATTGMEFSIEKLENGNWKECEYIAEVAWNEIAMVLHPKENTFSADWSRIYGSLEQGTYRFKKIIYADEKKEVYCEFTL